MKLRRLLIPSCALLAACRSGEPIVSVETDACATLRIPDHLSVSPKTVKIKTGDTLSLTVSIPECVSVSGPQTYRWNVGDSAVVSVEAATGLVHGRRSGVTTVTATAMPDSSLRGATVVEVSPP